jgi:hypothetical protein
MASRIEASVLRRPLKMIVWAGRTQLAQLALRDILGARAKRHQTGDHPGRWLRFERAITLSAVSFR